MKFYLAAETKYDLESVYAELPPDKDHIIDCFIAASQPSLAEETLLRIKNPPPHIKFSQVSVFKAEDSTLKNTYKGLGADRIAKLEGALKMFSGQNIMLMDFGTATTLNLVTKDAVFRGGFINLGLEASLRAIAKQLEGFEDYSKSDWFKRLIAGEAIDEIFPEESTAKAVVEGVYREHLALIEYYKNYASKKFSGEKFVSVCTGGNAGVFSSEFDKHVQSKELLNVVVSHLEITSPSS